MYIKTESGVYSKLQSYPRKKDVQTHIALLWQGKCTPYSGLQGSRGTRTKLEAWAEFRGQVFEIRNSVFQISGEDSRNDFLTPASAKDLESIYPSAGLLAI